MKKNIIVFGGSGVIGRAVCSSLFKKPPYRIYNADIFNGTEDIEGLDIYRTEKLRFLKCDILSSHSLHNTIDFVRNTQGPIHALINCTYPKYPRFMKKPWYDTLDEDYLTGFNHFLVTNIALCKIAYKYKIPNVILLSSIYGSKIPEQWMYDGTNIKKPALEYCMSKAALEYMVKYLSKDIRINCIAPGGIESDAMDRQFKQNYGEDMFTRPEDVANMVEYLISEKGAGINGQCITVDKGWSL
jgi:3-oxoacyl-[acyl-carrier protein] reductase